MPSDEEDLELRPLCSNENTQIETHIGADRGGNRSDESELPDVVFEQNNAEQIPVADDLEPTMVEKQLFKAVKENNADEVKRILDQENITDATTLGSIVHVAVYHGSGDVLQALLARPTTNHVDSKGRTSLHCAVWMGHKDCVSILVKRCPDLVNQPVVTSSLQGTLKGVLCRETCAGVDATDKIPSLEAGLTPLQLASQKADIESVRLLLAARANCHVLDNDNLTPLDMVGEKIPQDKYDMVSSERFLQVINALCAKGGKPTTAPAAKYRETPMHIAMRLECVDAIPILAKAGYDKPIQNKAGDTPLHIAARQRSKDPTTCPLITKLVSVYGRAGIECTNKKNENPLHIAVEKQWLLAVQTLLRHEADVVAQTKKGKTVLHLAANNHVILKELLTHPKSHTVVENLDSEGNTPLFLSIHAQKHPCVSLLLEHGANVKQMDSKGRTVLHCAINLKDTRILKTLFDHDKTAMKEIIDIEMNTSHTALHVAVNQNNDKGAEILVRHKCDLKKGATYNGNKVNKLTALQRATMRGREEIVKILSKADPSLVHAEDENGMKPIHWACIKRFSKIITILVNAGSDLSAKCIYPDLSPVNAGSDYSAPDPDKITFETTAMDLLIHRVPCSVDLLNKCMDSSFKVNKTSINIDYNILLPEDSNNSNRGTGNNGQMKVLNALVQTGDQVNQQSLFMHPLIESFLHLQWKRISGLYYLLIFAYMALVISFSCLILLIFGSEEEKLSENPLYVHIFLRVVIAISSIIHIPHEVLYMYYKPRNSTSYSLPWKRSTLRKKWKIILHSLFRFAKIVFTFVIILITVIDPTNRNVLPRELATGAVLLFWVQFMLLASRVPTYGVYMLMFFEVVANFFVILLAFTFLIVAFMIAFFIEFQAKPPFDTKSEAFLKTIVMMTNEFEYNVLFDKFQGNMTAQVFTKVVFLFFVLLVGIVVMNILLAKAILDVKKVDRLRKQAKFLCTYEHGFGCLECVHFKTTPLESKLEIKYDLQDLQFPNKLMHNILNKAYAVNDATKQQYKDEQMQNGFGKDKTTKSSDIMEMNQKIDLLTEKIDQHLKTHLCALNVCTQKT